MLECQYLGVRLVSVAGRAALLAGDEVFDVAELSDGGLPSDPMSLLGDRFEDVGRLSRTGRRGIPVADVVLGPPVPGPPVVLAVVANYEGDPHTLFPMVVGKSPSSVAGPFADVVLPDPRLLPLGQRAVIPEPEIGIVTRGVPRHVTDEEAAGYIAGYVVAQDVTERVHEFGPAASPWIWSNLPAKTLAKSFDTFCPIGPALVTPDELTSQADLRKRCWINGELAYDLAFEDMQWKPAQLVSLVSRFMTLKPGTLILSGSGPRVDGKRPQRLSAGDVVRTEIDGIGVIENRCVAEIVPSVPTWEGSFTRTATTRTPIASVWSQFTEQPLFEQWCGPCTEFDLRPGGRVCTQVAGRYDAEAEFVSIEPPTRLSLRFGYHLPDIALPAKSTMVTFELATVENGVSVLIRVDGIHPGLVEQQSATWDFLLSRLSASCEGGP